jgi:hypothetical protein
MVDGVTRCGPIYVALTQTAASLPYFLLALPVGSAGDIFDRRKLVLATETWTMGIALLLAVFVVEEVGTDLSQGPVLVTIECFVISQRTAEFVEAMHQYGRIRRRDGAYRWGIFRDTELTNRYLEIFLVNSWAEHLRQHKRQIQADRELEGRIQGYLAGEPVVRHLVYTYTKET